MTSKQTHSIIYTQVDEAPALATYSFLPIIENFTKSSGINFETRNISLSGRILAHFSDKLSEAQQQNDDLAELGKLTQNPDANIIKLPNISASIPQLKAAIKELQEKGYNVPDYPDNPNTEEEQDTQSRYAKVLGSAVNPVLREGNSDRRAPKSVKQFAMKNPHRMGQWSADSNSQVATMGHNDFFSNEKSITLSENTTATILFTDLAGNKEILKEGIALQKDEIIDATFMSISHLRSFIEEQLESSLSSGNLFSLHMKATMMKISDPIIFGEVVKTYYKDVFEKHAELFNNLGVNPNTGLQDVYAKIATLSPEQKSEIEADIQAVYQKRPPLAMVNSDKGITNLHVPSDIIIDASMPAMIRDSGKMWGPDGELQDTQAVIPDSCYAGVYQAVIENCKANGQFDPSTMGSVSNVGLMAQKAEEYGSHDKTFQAKADGQIQVLDSNNNVLLSHSVKTGDIWRMCQVKDIPVQDWIKLAVSRAKASNTPAVFWLNENRAHDAQLITKVNKYIQQHDISNIEYHIMSPVDATKFSLQRIRQGLDTISVTGNVLRDYNTDLFPILELGTSAKMLSIVPLMNGGGLFETGAGGSAPKHVQQFEQEGHLRWDSLGEFLALSASLEHYANVHNNPQALILAKTLDAATSKLLDEGKNPSRKVGELDNRGSHFYLALYWAEELAKQTENTSLSNQFKPIAQALTDNEALIIDELNQAQGPKQDLGGYYHLNTQKATQAMQPSATLNNIIQSITQ